MEERKNGGWIAGDGRAPQKCWSYDDSNNSACPLSNQGSRAKCREWGVFETRRLAWTGIATNRGLKWFFGREPEAAAFSFPRDWDAVHFFGALSGCALYTE